VADEVESYPCPLCPDRVFLTSFGLEKHSSENHQEHLQEMTSLAKERTKKEIMWNFGLCPDSNENVAGNGVEDADVGERRFKACNLCGILVDADSPAAMESHLRAHKKNDDLKLKLLARYGPEEVNRLMCNECNMVFGDECSLIVHNQQMHTRRRK
ncbi:zinc finger, C2H2 type, partial [Ancylostoma duodenale]